MVTPDLLIEKEARIAKEKELGTYKEKKVRAELNSLTLSVFFDLLFLNI